MDEAHRFPQLGDDEPQIDLENPPENPWKGDLQGSKEVAEILTTLIEGQERPLRLAVDGGWGTGKTYLLQRWAADLKRQGQRVIYYNAWEDDFVEDPLISILMELSKLYGDKEDSKMKQLQSIAAALVPTVAKSALQVVVQGTTGIPIDIDKLRRQAKENSQSHVVEEYEAATRSKAALKVQLRLVLEEGGDKPKQQDSPNGEDGRKPLVFIIDELDRCRPTFAIQVLERIKHVFDVEGIVFVLGMDQEQLQNSIRAVYGEQFDAHKYLHRFIHHPLVQLTDTASREFCEEEYRKQVGHALARITSRSGGFKDCLNEFLHETGIYFGLKLRDIRRCTTRLGFVCAKAVRSNNIEFPFTMWTVICIHHRYPDLYWEWRNEAITLIELIHKLDAQNASSRTGAAVKGKDDQLIMWLYAALSVMTRDLERKPHLTEQAEELLKDSHTADHGKILEEREKLVRELLPVRLHPIIRDDEDIQKDKYTQELLCKHLLARYRSFTNETWRGGERARRLPDTLLWKLLDTVERIK